MSLSLRGSVDVCSFVRHRWPSRLTEDGRWWLRFPFVFNEDETMWIEEYDRWPSRLVEDGRWWLRFPSIFSEDETMWIVIVGPPSWQRMGDGSSLSLCIQ